MPHVDHQLDHQLLDDDGARHDGHHHAARRDHDDDYRVTLTLPATTTSSTVAALPAHDRHRYHRPDHDPRDHDVPTAPLPPVSCLDEATAGFDLVDCHSRSCRTC